jgi:hypothetical protein
MSPARLSRFRYHERSIVIGGSLPIQPHGRITLTCCNFILKMKNEIRIELIAERAALASIYVGPRRTGTGLRRFTTKVVARLPPMPP